MFSIGIYSRFLNATSPENVVGLHMQDILRTSSCVVTTSNSRRFPEKQLKQKMCTDLYKL